MELVAQEIHKTDPESSFQSAQDTMMPQFHEISHMGKVSIAEAHFKDNNKIHAQLYFASSETRELPQFTWWVNSYIVRWHFGHWLKQVGLSAKQGTTPLALLVYF